MGEDPQAQRKPSLEKLLKYGIDPNALSAEDTGERRTLLCLAIEEAVKIEDYSKIDMLLEAKADPNRRSETGVFPLQLAVKHDQVKLSRKLLQGKADVNQQDAKLVSQLHTAAYQNQTRMVQLLLLHKGNLNCVDKLGQPPIFFAGSRDLATALLEGAADVLHLNNRGQSALHLAAHNGFHDVVSFLTEHEQLRHLIDLKDDRGRTALHHAAEKGHQCVISRLMDVGADAKAKTNNGHTAMSLADAKDIDVAYYIYMRTTGGNKSTWGEMAQNPIAMILAAVLGVACFVNRRLIWELFVDILAIYFER